MNVILRVVLVCAVLVAAKEQDDAASKKKMMEHKVNLGWPNFFNPEKAILRKNEGLLKKKKATEGDKSSILGGSISDNEELSSSELLEENRMANIVKDADRHENGWDNVEDLKIKDGLRGTLVLLNGSDSSDDSWKSVITEDTVDTIKDQLLNETNVYQQLGEITDDGLRLSMPLFRQRYAPSLGKYGAELTFFYSSKPTALLYYGNWCGRGGRIAPVDGLDNCCLEHAKCYGRQVKRCPDIWKKPYNTMYAWTLLEDIPYCVRSESTCVNNVCACDIEASLCLNTELGLRSSALKLTQTDDQVQDEDELEAVVEVEEDERNRGNEDYY